jgi:hypothetical protein
MSELEYIKPERELRWRDVWFSAYFFFWRRTAFVRRIWCKHHGAHMCGTSTKNVTVCANCYSPNVPQCCGAYSSSGDAKTWRRE